MCNPETGKPWTCKCNNIDNKLQVKRIVVGEELICANPNCNNKRQIVETYFHQMEEAYKNGEWK